jgi:hypothetical protein
MFVKKGIWVSELLILNLDKLTGEFLLILCNKIMSRESHLPEKLVIL